MEWIRAVLIIFLTSIVFQAHAQENKTAQFAYDTYAEVLGLYVDNRGMVNYEELKQNRDKLDAFVTSIGELDSLVYDSWDDTHKIAFLINAYNALTLRLIIDHYPIKASFFKSFIWPKNSIRQISGAWDRITFTVMGKTMTLDHIEHNILRTDFNEPRIHMALVCASKGCAKLARVPYAGETLNEQLNYYTALFVNNPEKIRIDKEKNTVFLSKYFQWFGDDFVPTYGTTDSFKNYNEIERAALNFISMYVSEEDRQYLAKGGYSIEYLGYDWSLNEQDEK